MQSLVAPEGGCRKQPGVSATMAARWPFPLRPLRRNGTCPACRGFDALPRAVPLQWRRASLLQADGRLLNTCTSEALVELLR